jgi:hypothetical protein
MADEKSRTDTVKENLDALIEKYGPEAWPQITALCLEEIMISTAMLVDGQS